MNFYHFFEELISNELRIKNDTFCMLVEYYNLVYVTLVF